LLHVERATGSLLNETLEEIGGIRACHHKNDSVYTIGYIPRVTNKENQTDMNQETLQKEPATNPTS